MANLGDLPFVPSNYKRTSTYLMHGEALQGTCRFEVLAGSPPTLVAFAKVPIKLALRYTYLTD